MKRTFLTAFLILFLFQVGYPWIYPEHRDILILAIKKLDLTHKKEFERYWAKIRVGYESRLSPWPADTTIAKNTKILDYASFPAIAGDHSVSASDMLNSILKTDWILKVSDVAYELKIGLAESKNRNERLNKLRDSDLKLLKADPQYVTRAGANNVHFMLARPEIDSDYLEYMTACVKEGAELNAPGVYWWYHLSALQKAGAYAADTSSEKSTDLLLAALADEGFAIHFLEDMFASGHVAGCWGNAAQRKGTHDYYDEKGIEVSTWEGKKILLLGDAFIRPQDADLAAKSVVKSLEQVIDAASGKINFLLSYAGNVPATPDTFNVGKDLYMPPRVKDLQVTPLMTEIGMALPMPGLAKGIGELPRFRSELGPFIGLSTAARGTVVFNGFEPSQNTAGLITGVEMSVRLGLGLEGVLNEAGDGMVFIDIGYRLDASSTMKLSPNPNYQQFGNIASAIPYRGGLHLRLRMPFYIVPGDLLLLAPILYFAAPTAMSNVVATAGNGGLIPWQTGLLTSIGRFQFVLGREVGVYLFGSNSQPDTYIIPVTINGAEDQAVVSCQSTQIEFPVVEYRPFHMFSSNQTASLMVQLFGGVDIPYNVKVVTPEGMSTPSLRAIPTLGLRVVFDWRYYFSGKKS
jgi:hypothetical protein